MLPNWQQLCCLLGNRNLSDGQVQLIRSYEVAACTLKSSHQFVRHIPFAIVMSISHISSCAMMCERKAMRCHLFYLV